MNIGLKRLDKTLIYSCERLLLGTLISDIEIRIEYLRLEHINLTLSNTTRRMDLGTLVVPFDQTFYPLHYNQNFLLLFWQIIYEPMHLKEISGWKQLWDGGSLQLIPFQPKVHYYYFLGWKADQATENDKYNINKTCSKQVLRLRYRTDPLKLDLSSKGLGFLRFWSGDPYIWTLILYVHQKREDISPSFFITPLQGGTPLSLILLPILSVFLLHSALTSHPSYLAGKGEELRT